MVSGDEWYVNHRLVYCFQLVLISKLYDILLFLLTTYIRKVQSHIGKSSINVSMHGLSFLIV